MRLASDDINAGGSESLGLTEGDLQMVVARVNSGTQAMEGFCNALEAVGGNGTFGIVGPMMSSQASLLEIISNDFFGLPLITPAAIAARAETYLSTGASGGGSYLMGLQPDVFAEMRALARLILDMKTERDRERGWYHHEEQVSVIYSRDTFGNIAASAFTQAVKNMIGINVDFDAAGPQPATIEISSIAPLQVEEGTNHRPVLRTILEKRTSIIVLLAEGYDGVFLRSVLTQAREVGLVNEGIQWYVNGGCATDGIFTVNQTYHDSQLAYDFRGTLGVRACTPTKGPGFEQISNLTERWASLDPDVYPGAGASGLTPDGRIDPLLAYAYDAVFALAGGIGAVQTTARRWGDFLEGFETDSCPFGSDGLWQDGKSIRDAAPNTEFVGVTGQVTFIDGTTVVTSGSGEAGSGWRRVNGTTFCAMNLQSHALLGATFVTLKSWMPDQWEDVNGTAALSRYADINPSQNNQSYPSGGDHYPFDRPTLQGMHLEVVTEDNAIPFAMVTGRETKATDYKGIALELVKSLSESLGFTYNVTVANSSVTSDEVLDWVAEGMYDVAASWTTITADRTDRVSFSFPFYFTGMAFVYRHDSFDEVNWWKMFEPFEPTLWAAILLSAVLVLVLLWIYDGAKNDTFARRTPSSSGSRRQFRKGLGLTGYVTGALLLGQLAHEPHTLEGFILSSGWMFACFIIAATFTAQLASFLLAEKARDLAFGVDDLRNGAVPHSQQVALLDGSTMKTFFENEIMKCYGDVECSKEESQPVSCLTQDECLELVANGTCKVTVMDAVTAAYRVANDFCNLDIIDETFNIENYGFALPKEAQYLAEIKQAVLEAERDGIINEIAEPYFDISQCAGVQAHEAVSASEQNITLMDVGGVFLILGIFVGISLVLWIFRRSPPAKKQRKKYHERQDKRQESSKQTELDAQEDSEEELPEEVRNLNENLDTRINCYPDLRRHTGTPQSPILETAEPLGQNLWRSRVLAQENEYANKEDLLATRTSMKRRVGAGPSPPLHSD
ncbi:unnamed protein product [Ascophyllum nodosum]